MIKMLKTEVAVIGGGPAGMAAALKASEGAEVMLLERRKELGGILPQCIHNGFGNVIFKEMKTGPEYAQYYIDEITKSDVTVKTETTVLTINSNKNIITANPNEGVVELQAEALILAMGCRERTRSQLLIPGTRPAGIFTAGTAQRLINIDGIMPGKKIVILGSGDVGLIMARRFILEGAEVEGVYEIMPEPGGLTRNIVQCLDDYDIPLHLSHTITKIDGRKRISGVTVAQVDESLKPLKETERYIYCDCLIFAVGLIPENELSKQGRILMDDVTGGPVVDERMETSIPGLFACGNVVHVYNLVDDVTLSSEIAGQNAKQHVNGTLKRNEEISVRAGENVRYVVPQRIRGTPDDPLTLYVRVTEEKRNVRIHITDPEKTIHIFEKNIVKPSEIVNVIFPSKKRSLLTHKELWIDVRGESEK